MRRTAAVDSLLILVVASILILPLFTLNYLDNWPSIESTFISDSRMLNENLPHPGWQPLWYAGTRFDYIYPPALRYGTAMISRLGGVSTARAYHLYTGSFYVLGFLAIYWLVSIGSRSRAAAVLATAGVAVLSPALRLVKVLGGDSGFSVPQRLHVLMAYGEGPHITALCILPGALAAGFVALRERRPAAIAIAALLCALTVSNNFYGATALALFFPLVIWAVWNGSRDREVFGRAAAVVALTAGLCAFWLTPSYVGITLVNMRWVSQPGNAASVGAAIAAALLFGWGSMRFAGKRTDRVWTVFVAGAALFLSMDVLGFYYFGFRIMGEPPRLAPELDLALILVGVEIVRHAWGSAGWRSVIAVAVVVACIPGLNYLSHAWTPFPKSGPIEKEYTYQTTKWLHDNVPGERILASGELRFWLDAWFDIAQLDGGSMQGMLNQNVPAATGQVLAGEKASLAIAWLQAFGTGVIVVPDAASRDHYKDHAHPEKYAGVLPVLYQEGGTTIYRVPRVHSEIARVVDKAAIQSIGKVASGDVPAQLANYLSIVEDTRQPRVSVQWHDFDTVELHATVSKGQAVLLQETFDPYWRASGSSGPLTVRQEPGLGFMLIDAPEGEQIIHLKFETPRENRAGQVLFVLSLFIVGALVAARKRPSVPGGKLGPRGDEAGAAAAATESPESPAPRAGQ